MQRGGAVTAAIDTPRGFQAGRTPVVVLGHRLHNAGESAALGSEVLAVIRRPMLLVEGCRGPFCDLDELRYERKRLKLAGSLHVVEGGGHSFELPKSQAARRSAEMNGAA